MAVLVIEHSPATNAERLAQTLNNYGNRLRYVKLHENNSLPGDLDDVDAVITCGGPQSAYDDSLPWLQAECALLKQAHEKSLPIIGLCLGSQVLARALGGAVEKMPGGAEIGWHELKLTPAGREDPLHAGIAWQSMQLHWHADHVSKLPPGARLLASSKKCTTQAWAIGLRTYGFQHHPEVTLPTFRSWIDQEPQKFKDAGNSLDEFNRQCEELFPAFERLSQRLFEAIALFLMPVDRRYHGAVKDLHH
ncbi:MAG TPA: type 1 glutamine amidotransferase [Phycisphaerales bacterium]|nr:type 1 glutamine amidotransferase [Phycisphaerales bacterium]